MDRITEAEIATSVKKHYGMTLLIAMAPLIPNGFQDARRRQVRSSP